jgi:hypothetical protein
VGYNATAGSNDFKINTKAIPTGVYYVSVSADNQTRAVEKIVIVTN